MKILLVDDHALIREGTRLLLDHLEDEIHIDEAASFTQMRRLLRENSYALILLDFHLPDGQGVEGVRALVCDCPDTAVVMLSGDSNPRAIRTLLGHGVRGFISKQSPSKVILAALTIVLHGGTYVPPEALDFIDTVTGPGRQALTARQIEVLRLLCKGFTNKEIAAELGTSSSTVRAHVSAIFRALDVDNRTQASQAAAARSIV